MFTTLSPNPVRTCHICGGLPAKFQIRPSVFLGGKPYLVVKKTQLPTPKNSKFFETFPIPVIYIMEIES